MRFLRRSYKPAGTAPAPVVATLRLLLAFAVAGAAASETWMSPMEMPTERELARLASMSEHRRLSVPDGEYLAPFLVPRVSGTPANIKVRNFVIDHFRKLGWHVQVDNFTDPSTPHGPIEFANVIATKSRKAKRRLIFSAHYDSKYFPNDTFIGATDSAVPCAILLDLAYTLNDLLNPNAADTTLQMVFFDGEEAFVQWTATDSLYGSRHLAEKWGSTFLTMADSPQGPPESLLDTIDALFLLDLLGASDVSLPLLQPLTKYYFQALQDTEASLLSTGVLLFHPSEIENATARTVRSSQNQTGANGRNYTPYFNEGWAVPIEDDHVPFLERGVPIVHLINFPFPSVWHKPTDNADAIDPVVVYNLNLIFRVFLAQYFGLGPRLQEATS